MRKFWKQGGESVETRLRAERSDAPAHLVASIGGRVASAGRPRHAWSRAAFAGAVATVVLGTFVSFGGVSYASSATQATVNTVTKIAAQHKVFVRHSAAQDEYATPEAGPTNNGPTGGTEGTQATQATQATGVQGTLPFTGISLAATFVVSLMLIAAGAMLRRWERRRQ